MKTLSAWIDVLVKWFLTAMHWLLLSSADPNKASATVKYALLATVPFVIKSAAFACGFGLLCLSWLNAPWLEQAIAFIGNVVFWLAGLIGAVGALWSFARKITATAAGNNPVVSNGL